MNLKNTSLLKWSGWSNFTLAESKSTKTRKISLLSNKFLFELNVTFKTNSIVSNLIFNSLIALETNLIKHFEKPQFTQLRRRILEYLELKLDKNKKSKEKMQCDKLMEALEEWIGSSLGFQRFRATITWTSEWKCHSDNEYRHVRFIFIPVRSTWMDYKKLVSSSYLWFHPWRIIESILFFLVWKF